MARKPPYPFVKWAGGKTKAASLILQRLPEKINTYYEPMIGGGAILIALAKEKRFQKAVISDTNPELINAWKVVKGNVEPLILALQNPKLAYNKQAFLKVRSENTDAMDSVDRAARFIYLVRVSFNGLYRVNKEGKFNAPFGRYKDPIICDIDNLKAMSELLKSVTIYEQGYNATVAPAKLGDAVYFDPPYLPISETSSFTAYTKEGFSLEDHQKLASKFKKLGENGVRVVLTNSVSPETKRLFGKFDIDYFTGKRSIGGPVEYRKDAQEMVVFHGPKVT